MQLRDKTIKELQGIIKKDYGRKLSKEHANKLGVSLLRLTRLALAALARENKKS